MAVPQNHTRLEEMGRSASLVSSPPSRTIQGGADQGLQRPCPTDGQAPYSPPPWGESLPGTAMGGRGGEDTRVPPTPSQLSVQAL